MIFVESLPGVYATEDSDRQAVLDNPEESLKRDEDDGEETKNTVRGNEVGVVALVHFDDDEGAQKADYTGYLDAEVDARAEMLLLRGCGWLEDECSLDLEEERGDGEELR